MSCAVSRRSVYAGDIVGKERMQFAVVAESMRRRRLPKVRGVDFAEGGAYYVYKDVAPSSAAVYWSYDLALDRDEVQVGLRINGHAAGDAVSRLSAVNHMPGVFYLAVKSQFCTELMEMKSRLKWYDITPECFCWGTRSDRVKLRRIWASEGKQEEPTWWLKKIGSHRNTSVVSTGTALFRSLIDRLQLSLMDTV